MKKPRQRRMPAGATLAFLRAGLGWKAVPGVVKSMTRSRSFNDEDLSAMVFLVRESVKLAAFRSGDFNPDGVTYPDTKSVIEAFFSNAESIHGHPNAGWAKAILTRLLENPQGCALAIEKILAAIRTAQPKEVIVGMLFDRPDPVIASGLTRMLGKEYTPKDVSEIRYKLGLKKPAKRRVRPDTYSGS